MQHCQVSARDFSWSLCRQGVSAWCGMSEHPRAEACEASCSFCKDIFFATAIWVHSSYIALHKELITILSLPYTGVIRAR